jgi:uncharacterized Zn finger protein
MGQLIYLPSCAFCHSDEFELIIRAASQPMVACDVCGYTTQASIEYFDQPLTRVSVS